MPQASSVIEALVQQQATDNAKRTHLNHDLLRRYSATAQPSDLLSDAQRKSLHDRLVKSKADFIPFRRRKDNLRVLEWRHAGSAIAHVFFDKYVGDSVHLHQISLDRFFRPYHRLVRQIHPVLSRSVHYPASFLLLLGLDSSYPLCTLR